MSQLGNSSNNHLKAIEILRSEEKDNERVPYSVDFSCADIWEKKKSSCNSFVN